MNDIGTYSSTAGRYLYFVHTSHGNGRTPSAGGSLADELNTSPICGCFKIKIYIFPTRGTMPFSRNITDHTVQTR